MSNSALIMAIVAEVTITAITFYFFWKVFKTPPKQEPDSFTENDGEAR